MAETFVARHLQPADRLAEAMCGLIMVLTFTLAAAPNVAAGPEGVRELLVGALGCNIAWGIIDGTIYVLNQLLARGRTSRVVGEVQQAPTPDAKLARVRQALEPALERVSTAAARDRLYRDVVDVTGSLERTRPRLERGDLMGGVAVFLLNFGAAIPAIIPFLVLGDPRVALRVSNAVLLAMLFGVGYSWGRLTGSNRWVVGSVLLLIGLLLVGIAIPLGG